MSANRSENIIMAVPKGRILDELVPLMKKAKIIPEKAFFDTKDRRLLFSSNISWLKIIRVRSFDVATFVAFGGADIGVAGLDVLKEFNYPELYMPIDLKIGTCHLSIAELKNYNKDDNIQLKIATKYPNITNSYFANKGINVNCIKINGAMEIAPNLEMADKIVDLVSSGKTLLANDLVEIENILNVTSHLVINRTAFKTRSKNIRDIMVFFREALNEKNN
ncbi:MAG: ATP phosphoribosyltransferase [Alphaproteobacteria bacterium MarineAlpha9_Bin3]|nr:MAG: ATP phosphoribosyltransferase [Alphaproteobacteria bacterium MarineAlpha9_Bin3]|tara:strand:+ start:6724 stop:7386 length:663 start_codon:yes stop_codon:yes gene_type:complete